MEIRKSGYPVICVMDYYINNFNSDNYIGNFNIVLNKI